MRFVLKDSTGEIHQTDNLGVDELIQYMMDEGCPEHQVEREIKDNLNEMIQIFKSPKSASNLTLEIESQKIFFNPDHVVWIKVIDAQEFVDRFDITL